MQRALDAASTREVLGFEGCSARAIHAQSPAAMRQATTSSATMKSTGLRYAIDAVTTGGSEVSLAGCGPLDQPPKKCTPHVASERRRNRWIVGGGFVVAEAASPWYGCEGSFGPPLHWLAVAANGGRD